MSSVNSSELEVPETNQKTAGQNIENITNIISSDSDDSLSIENLPYHGHLSLSVYAQDMTLQWKRCEIVSNFISQFYSGANRNESIDTNSISTIINELIENAAKYSEKENSKVFIEIKDLGNKLRVDVKNRVSSRIKLNFETITKTIASGNINQMYFDALESKHKDDQTSGIGLLMLLNDYHLNIAYQIKNLHSDSFEITVRAHIPLETLY